MKETSGALIRTPEGRLLSTKLLHPADTTTYLSSNPFNLLNYSQLLALPRHDTLTYHFFLFLFILNTKIKAAVAPQVMEVEYVNTNEQYYEYNVKKYIIYLSFDKC